MKRNFTRLVKIISMILALGAVFGIGANALAAEAVQPRANNYINDAKASISAIGSGKVKISFTVTGTGVMDEIGVSSIIVYESTDQTNWTGVAMYPYNTNPNLVAFNTTTLSSSVTYSGVAGRYYKAYVCFWAGNSGVGDSTYQWTSIVKAS